MSKAIISCYVTEKKETKYQLTLANESPLQSINISTDGCKKMIDNIGTTVIARSHTPHDNQGGTMLAPLISDYMTAKAQ
jgi:hypothetical protein